MMNTVLASSPPTPAQSGRSLGKQISSQADTLVKIVLAHPDLSHTVRSAIDHICMELDALSKEVGG